MLRGANSFCNCKMLQPTLCHSPTKGSLQSEGPIARAWRPICCLIFIPLKDLHPKKVLRYVSSWWCRHSNFGAPKLKTHKRCIVIFSPNLFKTPMLSTPRKTHMPRWPGGVGDKGTSPCSARTSAKSQGGKREIQSKPPGLVTKHCYPYHAVCPFRYYPHGPETVFLRYLFSSFQVDKLERTWILRYWCLWDFWNSCCESWIPQSNDFS